ncbi:MAG: hypothetical protein E5X86_35560 [Mesorhizobium sp.]|uniref:hypothetical protein n=1 Tax=Mesorhizobium sp. TaxID=1871066 RepID=UPI0012052734|nr:hypothetical protein [Mesorhizobium sp.]TIO11885.1 MAG: hypothetical protein E5X86_35560 [Mesorhizobium sp.]
MGRAPSPAKQRQLALKAGAPNERGVGRRGAAYAYNVKELRNRDKAAAENAERAYELMVRHCVKAWPRSVVTCRTVSATASLDRVSTREPMAMRRPGRRNGLTGTEQRNE